MPCRTSGTMRAVSARDCVPNPNAHMYVASTSNVRRSSTWKFSWISVRFDSSIRRRNIAVLSTSCFDGKQRVSYLLIRRCNDVDCEAFVPRPLHPSHTYCMANTTRWGIITGPRFKRHNLVNIRFMYMKMCVAVPFSFQVFLCYFVLFHCIMWME